MKSPVQSPDALFVFEEIHSSRPKVQGLEGCELCQHCTLLRAILRSRNVELQNRLGHAQGEKHDVKQ